MCKKHTILFLALLMLSCASPTPYQQETNSEGYSELKLSSRSYQITFKANKKSNKNRIYDFTLLRAAQLALSNGYHYFRVTKKETYVSYKLIEIPQEPEYDSYSYPLFYFQPGLFKTTKHTLTANTFCEMVDRYGKRTRVNMTDPLTSSLYLEMYDKHVSTSPITTTYTTPENIVNSNNQSLIGYSATVFKEQNKWRIEMPEVKVVIYFEEKILDKDKSYDAKQTKKRITQQYQIEL